MDEGWGCCVSIWDGVDEGWGVGYVTQTQSVITICKIHTRSVWILGHQPHRVVSEVCGTQKVWNGDKQL